MNWIVEAILTGITSFVATNIDDIVILTLFFAKVGETLRQRDIVAGQYLGFLGLIAASLPGFLGGLVIPQTWLGWLGLLPIAIGLYHLLSSDQDSEIQTISLQPETGRSNRSQVIRLLSPQTYQIAAITIANGGDNIGIYVPLFANLTWAELVIVLTVFLAMIALFCAIAARLATQPLLSRTLVRYGDRIVPFVLIGLGIFIFVDSGTYRLLR